MDGEQSFRASGSSSFDASEHVELVVQVLEAADLLEYATTPSSSSMSRMMTSKSAKRKAEAAAPLGAYLVLQLGRTVRRTTDVCRSGYRETGGAFLLPTGLDAGEGREGWRGKRIHTGADADAARVRRRGHLQLQPTRHP